MPETQWFSCFRRNQYEAAILVPLAGLRHRGLPVGKTSHRPGRADLQCRRQRKRLIHDVSRPDAMALAAAGTAGPAHGMAIDSW